MQMNTKPLAETIGNIAATKTLTNGQADTRLYSEAEKQDEFNHGQRMHNIATSWEGQPVAKFLGQM